MFGIEVDALPFLTGIAIVTIVFSFLTVAAVVDAIRKTSQSRHKEESRREIAAYVAEGSISPADGAKLLDAGGKKTVGLVQELGLDAFASGGKQQANNPA